MKDIKIICDFCGKSMSEFKSPQGFYFNRSEVNIEFSLFGSSYVSELDKDKFSTISVDLCGECSIKLKKMIENEIKK